MTQSVNFDEVDPHIVLVSGEETNGDYARFESTLHPSLDIEDTELEHERWGIDLTAEHVHPEQEEHIKVVAGEMQVEFRGETRTVTQGEDITFPAGEAHRHWNASDRPARIQWEVRPALRTEEWTESVYVLAQAGETDEEGAPGLLQSAVIFDEYPDTSVYLTVAPVSVQRAASSVLAPIGRLLGYEAIHRRTADATTPEEGASPTST
jgi:mannose-6-phosphate isomerase-like protein (cupin superfamily)